MTHKYSKNNKGYNYHNNQHYPAECIVQTITLGWTVLRGCSDGGSGGGGGGGGGGIVYQITSIIAWNKEYNKEVVHLVSMNN